MALWVEEPGSDIHCSVHLPTASSLPSKQYSTGKAPSRLKERGQTSAQGAYGLAGNGNTGIHSLSRAREDGRAFITYEKNRLLALEDQALGSKCGLGKH